MVFIPRQAMRLWGILWFLIFLGKSWGREQRYVISTAKDFHFRIPENVSTQAHGYTKAFKATVSRKSYPDGRIQPTQLSEGEDSVLEAVFEHFSNLNEIPTINTSVSLFNDADKFLHTDKFLYTPRHSDEAYKEMTNSSNVTTVLKEEIEQIAAKYRHPVVKKCCYDGARRNDRETCDQRAAQITIGPRCVRAFSECCVKANQIRANDTHKYNLIRMEQEHQLTINIARVRRDLKKVRQTQTVEQQAAKYTNPRVKRCCHDGARPNNFESCQERAARVTLGPHCVRAFTDCCVIAKRNRDQTNFKPVSISSVRHQGEIQR